MPQGLVATELDSPVAKRLFPRDHRVRLASVDVLRHLEEQRQIHESFEKHWFSDDPPNFEKGRETLALLLEELTRERNSLLELVRLTKP